MMTLDMSFATYTPLVRAVATQASIKLPPKNRFFARFSAPGFCTIDHN
jgi:hypothetical protein